MGSEQEQLFERRAFLRTLGISGGVFGMSQMSGTAGATQFGGMGSATGAAADVDAVGISTIATEVFDELRDGFDSRIWNAIDEWKESGWGTVVDNVREIVDLIASSASDALETIEDALGPVEFILDNTTEIVKAIGDKADSIREELEGEEEKDEESSGSLGRATPSTGAGAGSAAGTATIGAGATTRSFHSGVTETIGKELSKLEDVADGLVDFVDKLGEGLREQFETFWDDVKEFESDLKSGIRSLIEPAIDTIIDLVVAPVDKFTDVWESATSGDGVPSFEFSYDVFDIDLGIGVEPMVDPTEGEPTFDATASDIGSMGAGAGASAGSGTNTGAGAASPLLNVLPIDPQILEIEDCPNAPGPIHALGMEFSLLETPIVDLSDLSFTPYLGFGWAPCFFYGAEAETELGVDITSLYEALVLFQDAWAEVAGEIEADAENLLTELEDASDLGEYEAVAADVKAFVETMEDRLEPHGIPLSLLMDQLSPDVDLMELFEIAESLEEDVAATIERFVDSDLADAIVELDDVVNAIDLNEDIPGIADIAAVGGEIAEAQTRKEIEEIEVEDLLRLSRGYRDFASWLETLDADERARIEAETGIDVDAVEERLELLTQQTIDVGGWVNDVTEKALTKLLEKLKEKAAELTERTYDLASEWDGFKCRSMCLDPRRLLRTVATIALLPIIVSFALADFLFDEFLDPWLPSAIDWVGRWFLRILTVLAMVAILVMVANLITFLAGGGSIGTLFPEGLSSVVGVAALAIAAGLAAGTLFTLIQAADALDADRRVARQYANNGYQM